MPPLINKVIRDLERYSLEKFGSATGVTDKLIGRFGGLVKGNYSVHHSGPTPKNLTSIVEKGLEARPAPGGQPPLLFSWNTLNDAGLLANKRSWGESPPRMASSSNEILAFLLKNSEDSSFSRGGVPGSLTTRRTVPPEDLSIIDPASFGGRQINKRLLAKIPPEMLIKMQNIEADDILEQLFAMGIRK
jgi:hypothetical protein